MSALANRSGSPSTRLLASLTLKSLTLKSLTVAIVALATVASCASSLEAMGSRPAATTTSAVGIEAEGCSLVPAVASGAVVGAPGLVMTVAHAVAGSRRITVTDHEGSHFPATLRYLDPESDIAILHVEGLADRANSASPLAIRSIDPPVDGHLVVRNSNGGIEAKPVTLTKRLNVTIEDIYIDTDVQRSAFEVLGDVNNGDSGGMVIVEGSVAAMIYSRSRSADLGFALDEAELRDALSQLDVNDASAVVSSGTCVP